MPKVSVIIPCYNQAHFLPEAVESVAAQAYRDFEIIIVDDGSPDDTAAVAGALMRKHPDIRMRLIRQGNAGLASARNSGIGEAAGEYILPLDSDDMILPDMLAETVRVLDENPAIGIAYPRLGFFGEAPEGCDGSTYQVPYGFGRLIYKNHLPVCSLFRRSAWESVGGYKKEMAEGLEDWEFWITLGEAGYFGMPAEKAVFMYRVKKSSMFTESLKVRPMLCYRIRGLHPRLYYPRLHGASPALARAVNLAVYVFHRAFDSVSGYLRVNHGGLHAALSSRLERVFRPLRHRQPGA